MILIKFKAYGNPSHLYEVALSGMIFYITSDDVCTRCAMFGSSYIKIAWCLAEPRNTREP